MNNEMFQLDRRLKLRMDEYRKAVRPLDKMQVHLETIHHRIAYRLDRGGATPVTQTLPKAVQDQVDQIKELRAYYYDQIVTPAMAALRAYTGET